MTPTPTAAQQNPLDLATLNTMLRAALDTVPHHPQASADEIATQREAVMLAIAALRPRDPLEAMLAGRYVATHHAVMEAFRCAALPDFPPVLVLRFQAKAIALSHLMDVTLRELTGRQQNAPVCPAELPAPMPAPRPQTLPGPQTASGPQTAPGPQPAPSAPPPPVVNKDPIHREIAARLAPEVPVRASTLVCERVQQAIAARPVAAPTARAA